MNIPILKNYVEHCLNDIQTSHVIHIDTSSSPVKVHEDINPLTSVVDIYAACDQLETYVVARQNLERQALREKWVLLVHEDKQYPLPVDIQRKITALIQLGRKSGVTVLRTA
jgi:hypothetical protein